VGTPSAEPFRPHRLSARLTTPPPVLDLATPPRKPLFRNFKLRESLLQIRRFPDGLSRVEQPHIISPASMVLPTTSSRRPIDRPKFVTFPTDPKLVRVQSIGSGRRTPTVIDRANVHQQTEHNWRFEGLALDVVIRSGSKKDCSRVRPLQTRGRIAPRMLPSIFHTPPPNFEWFTGDPVKSGFIQVVGQILKEPHPVRGYPPLLLRILDVELWCEALCLRPESGKASRNSYRTWDPG